MAKEGEASGPEALQLLAAPSAPRLSALTALDVRDAALSLLPASLALCEGLTRLDVGGNALSTLPDALATLPRLKVLFASKCRFAELPAVLADCKSLRMVSFGGNALTRLQCSRLPIHLEWLIAANNKITAIEDAPRLRHVRKLMLSHNELTCAALSAVGEMEGLEMLRVAANSLEALPESLLAHKRLAWVALGGNPFTEKAMAKRLLESVASVDFAELELKEALGSGAGATVHAARWRGQEVAVKLWQGERFSDGTSRGEWAANRVAGAPGHGCLVGVLGTFEEPRPGMVLERIYSARAAASPPSVEAFTVTRDLLPKQGGKGPVFAPEAALRIARAVAEACEYLQGRGIMHGDVYLHNTLVVCEGEEKCSSVRDVRLSDLGAASAVEEPRLLRMEARSFGWLLEDLVELVAPEAPDAEGTKALLRALRVRCAREKVEDLPSFAELVRELAGPKPAL